jgi:hypothetical protein
MHLARSFPVVAAIVIAMTLLAGDSPGSDIHCLWDRRCGDGHGEAVSFARQPLTIEDDALGGRHRKDPRLLLRNHDASATDTGATYAILRAQVSAESDFKQRCGMCHGTAAQLAREALTMRDGTLYGVASRQPVSAFLDHHGRLNPDEIPFFVDLLTRVKREVTK